MTDAEVFHPGGFIREELRTMGWSQARLARALGWKRANVGSLLAGRRNITPATAIRLSRVLGASASYWMNLQTAYDLYQESKRQNGTPKP